MTKVNTSIRVEEGVLKNAQHRALKEGKTISEILEKALADYAPVKFTSELDENLTVKYAKNGPTASEIMDNMINPDFKGLVDPKDTPFGK